MAIRTLLTVEVQSRNYRDLPASTGKITHIEFDKVERSKNAVRTLGIGLGLTAFSAMIPIMHWFLVPMGFIASIVFAMDKLNEGARSEGGTGICPKCRKEFNIEKSKFQATITDTCNHCHEDLEINLQTSEGNTESSD